MTKEGSYIKPNPKYVEAAAELLGLTDSKPAATPLATGDRADSELESPKLDSEQHSIYRRVVGALLYLTHDRGDAAYAVRLLAKDLRTPTADSWRRMKSVARYLLSHEGPRDILSLWRRAAVEGLAGLHGLGLGRR